MNDDDRFLRAELASAYLDNELDPDERARAAADPGVMSTVTAYTGVRGAVGDVAPPAAAARDAALAAALAAFDAEHTPQPASEAASAGVLTALRHRRAKYTYRLVGFAAAGLLAVVAVAAITSGGDDMKSSSSATVPAEAPDAGQRNKATPQVTEQPGILSIEALPTAAVPAVDTPDALVQFAAEQTSMAADSAATVPPETDAPAGGGAAPEAASGGPQSAAPALTCIAAEETLLGEITVLGEPAYAVRENASGELRAVAQADCRVLFAVSP